MGIKTLKNKVNNIFPALSHRNFRLFWIGQCISLIGTWMQNIGQSWLVLELTGSALKLGTISAVQFIPMMVFSLFAGTLVDRYSKRKMLIITQTCLMVLAAVLATITLLGIVQYWHILVLALLLGIVNTLDMPTRQTFFIELVGREDLMNAIALNSSIFNLARIIGPAVAGVLIGLLGISICFYLNAFSFMAVIAGLWLIKLPPMETVSKVKNTFNSIMADIKEGLKYTVSQPVIYLPLLLLSAISAFVLNFSVLVPIFASQNLGQNAMGYGLLMTSMGLGSFTGALVQSAHSGSGPRTKVLLAGAIGVSLFVLILGFVKSYALACILLLIAGFGAIIFTTSVNSMIQLNSSDAMRGRVMSVYSLVFGGVIPIGSMYSGNVAESLGAPVCMAISGAIGILASLGIGFLMLGKKNATIGDGS